jgi:hypothetical protein
MRVAYFSTLLALLIVSCSGVKPTPPAESAHGSVPQPGGGIVEPAASSAAPPTSPSQPVAKRGERPAVTPPEHTTPPSPATAPASTSQPKAEAPAANAPAKVAAPAAAAMQPPKKIAQEAVKPKAEAPLDLTSLETRLKETKAIGVMTKIALKNQVDDLLNQFRAFYAGKLKTTLAELRRPYDLLVLKVLSLLQDSDPSLAEAIVASREAIWGILSDPVKFANFASN